VKRRGKAAATDLPPLPKAWRRATFATPMEHDPESGPQFSEKIMLKQKC
jgi:hypothetical protein